MPVIAPFAALRYNPERFGQDISDLVAPPYDVLELEDKNRLRSRDERNIVTVDLPHVPPKKAGPDAVYAEAARRLQQWRSDGTLIAEHDPAIYVYHQIYDHGGRSFVRRMFFARMRLEPFGTGTVFPHEQTFGGPKEDRLKLMQATRCQLSPIFGLYSDPENAISGRLDVEGRAPDATAEMDDVRSELYVISDDAVIRDVQEQCRQLPVYIADGHHRYSTALNYLEQLTQRQPSLPDGHPARFVFIGLCAMEDPGCVILPTHRVLTDLGRMKPADLLQTWQPGLETVTAEPGAVDPSILPVADSRCDVMVYIASGDRYYAGRFTNRDVLADLAPDRSDAWRSLDLAYLHRYLIDELLMNPLLEDRRPRVHCVKSLEDTLRLARETGGIAILTKACTMAELRDVSHAGDLMPQKSTFFYPKLATGMLIHPLE